MSSVKSKNLTIRLSNDDKRIIENYARRCGLSTSEFVRQRALMFNPKVIPPEEYFSLKRKIENLCVLYQSVWTDDMQNKMLGLISDMTIAFELPEKERAC